MNVYQSLRESQKVTVRNVGGSPLQRIRRPPCIPFDFIIALISAEISFSKSFSLPEAGCIVVIADSTTQIVTSYPICVVYPNQS